MHDKCAPARPANAPWAMVPLNPNELSRDVDEEDVSRDSIRAAASTGMRNGDADAIEDKCAFSLKHIEKFRVFFNSI